MRVCKCVRASKHRACIVQTCAHQFIRRSSASSMKMTRFKIGSFVPPLVGWCYFASITCVITLIIIIINILFQSMSQMLPFIQSIRPSVRSSDRPTVCTWLYSIKKATLVLSRKGACVCIEFLQRTKSWWIWFGVFQFHFATDWLTLLISFCCRSCCHCCCNPLSQSLTSPLPVSISLVP